MERLYTSYRGEEYQNQRQKYEPEYTAEHVEKKYYNREFHKIRREALAEYVKPYVDFSKVTTVLDYGGDEGQMIPHQFKNAGKYVYDISGNQTVEGVSMINDLDVVKRTSWDFLMCCQLLEHVSNPHEVISTLASCLSDGGYLYLEVPAKAPFRQYSDVEVSEHISFYTKETMYEIGNIFPLQVKSVEIFSLQGKVALRALFQKKSQ
jgi:SAM-dependent methyltransferase